MSTTDPYILRVRPERTPCTRCDGYGRLSADGPRCPHCQGRGFEPQRRLPSPPAEVANPILAELARLGELRKVWEKAKTRESAEKRHDIRCEIREAARQALRAGLLVREIHEALGISRQAYNNTINENPTGRR